MTAALLKVGAHQLSSYNTHVPISTIHEQVRSLFKFAFVRNPWDRLWSMYKFTMKRGWIAPDMIFDDWVQSSWATEACEYQTPVVPITQKPQMDWISVDGAIVIDYVGRYENVVDDFSEICNRIGVTLSLPHINSTPSSDYRKVYTDFSSDFVSHHYKKDIEAFDYEF